MNDYFDQLESELKGALSRRAHIPWYARLRLPVRHRGVAVLVVALVVATPTVAAVGAVSGWFSPGKPDVYYPASSTSGLGKVLPKGDRLLPMRVADPDGGPPWGIRLVKTTRDATCIQVGRVVDGQIGQLGIDTAWHDDHEFHEIKPNDQLADICGETDSAGNGFVNWGARDAPASVDVPLDNSVGGPGRCLSPFKRQPLPGLSRKHVGPALQRMLKRIEQERAGSVMCPASGMRFIFTGLLGPDAKSVTYRTPSGQTKTERTVGPEGAYLIVFRETESNCADYTRTLELGHGGCASDGEGADTNLQGPSAVLGVTYENGKTCSDQPSPSFAAAYRAFEAKMQKRNRHESITLIRRQWAAFDRSQGLTPRTEFQAGDPQCPPVGRVVPSGPKLTAAQVASPVTVKLSEGTRFCSKGPREVNTTIPCDGRVPKGYQAFNETSPAREVTLATVSFTARQAVDSANSHYSWLIMNPGNHGGGGSWTQSNVRAGQRITFNQFVTQQAPGIYRGMVAFQQNAGQNGPGGGGLAPMLLARHGGSVNADGSLVVARFSFRIPPHH
jgi:hypothetical protein